MTQNNIIAYLTPFDAEIQKRAAEEYPFLIGTGWEYDSYTGRKVLNFRGVRDTSCNFSFIVPMQYDSNHKFDVKVRCVLANEPGGSYAYDGSLRYYDGASASGIVQWDLKFAKITDGVLIADIYDFGNINELEITFDNIFQIESGTISVSIDDLGNPSPGDMIIMNLSRNVAGGTTSKSVQLVDIIIYEGDIY